VRFVTCEVCEGWPGWGTGERSSFRLRLDKELVVAYVPLLLIPLYSNPVFILL
jgi:hypothetical protein